jgi:hypothetical protein
LLILVPSQRSRPLRHIDKLTSLRFQMRCAIPAAVLAGICGAIWAPLILPVALLAWAICLWAGLRYGETEYFCPRCGKALRTARQAVRCHHCGHDLEPEPARP